MTPALRAARFAAAAAGHATDDPVVIADSNNTVVWLRPHKLVAKVGHGDGEALSREHAIGAALAAAGAPVAAPLAGVGPLRDPGTGLPVTLWERIEADGREPGAAAVADSLRALHDGLRAYGGELPTLHDLLRRPREALDDDERMRALAPADRGFLRDAFDSLTRELDARTCGEQPLHGEPHDGNYVATAAGVRWIDLETACTGPLEWDVVGLPDEVHDRLGAVDRELLELLRTLTSARVATWCWAGYERPALRWHAEFHLARVRERVGS